IEVTFDIDTDGVVNVSAKDLGTGKSQAIKVTASSGLTEAEVNRLLAEAQSNAEADRARRDLVDLKNRADGLVYSTERTLTEFAEQVPAEDKEALSAAVSKTRQALERGQASELSAAVDELSALSYKMTEKLYATLGGDPSAS
ncbi:MAG TPA: molecular chaperone DnaK, partial [Deltaproteobacteria bacterium]|nr:molecular chaperone DnaK [Deltaproteobacteria bacterium]